MVMDASLYAGCKMILFPSVHSFTNLYTLNKMICNFCKLTMLVWNGFNKESICNGGLPSLGQNLDCFLSRLELGMWWRELRLKLVICRECNQ